MPFQIIRNDITKVAADAIVNTANPRPVIGGGTDTAIYNAAGRQQLLAEREKIGDIEPGQAVSTPAFGLKARYIIHTVGPIWIDGQHGEREILQACYANSLALAAELGCESIAFPMIATGTYGFPKSEALDIALKEIGKFLLTHEMEITLVVFDRKSLELSEKLVGEIDEYIDEHTVGLLRSREYGSNRTQGIRRRRQEEERRQMNEDLLIEDFVITQKMSMSLAPSMMQDTAYSEPEDPRLEELLNKKEDTFQQRLFKLIDERKLSDPEVYKKANSNRKVFSKIRCNVNYKPKKETAVAYGIALRLDMPAMQDLLSRAGLALSPTSKFDLIISYFITNRIYEMTEINTVLFKYGQPLLGNWPD